MVTGLKIDSEKAQLQRLIEMMVEECCQFLPISCRAGFLGQVLQDHVSVVLVRFIWSNREMEARLGKIIFKVSKWVGVIVSLRSGREKLSSEQAGIAKPEVDSSVQLVFGNQIEFVADVPACAGMGDNRNGPAAGVIIVI